LTPSGDRTILTHREGSAVHPDKPWFGPIRSIGKAIVPLTWQGYGLTVALFLGFGLLRLEADLIRRSIAMALVVVAYGAVVILTWGDPESASPPNWRAALFNRGTLLWLAMLVAIVAAMTAAGFYGARPLH
jgi:hypothetical protein